MNFKKSQIAWDLWCILSIIGIWPRFIEPNLIKTTRLSIKFSRLSQDLEGFKILQFSDLHWHKNFSKLFAEKLVKKINSCNPDLIVFTGDFICRSQLENKEDLKNLLNQISAPYGCYAVLGNHDYSDFVTVNDEGDYDIEEKNNTSNIIRGFRRLVSRSHLTKKMTTHLEKLTYHQELIHLLKETPFQLLNNTTKQIPVKNTALNICGLEEYTTGRSDLESAFKTYDQNFLGIILAHNPDLMMGLKNQPGDLILSGHTHGGQINIPWMWKKFTRIENLNLKRGLIQLNSEKIGYINRGISSVMKFRWWSVPELTLITLKK